MKRLSTDIIQFFQSQGFVIVSTIDKYGSPHNSCKGIVRTNRNGRVYMLDLYKGKTYENIRQNPHISIAAVDEHRFVGYCMKGKAKIIKRDKLRSDIINAWENMITSRITKRILKNIHGEKGHRRHPETLLPKPEYLINMEVEEVIDLTPYHLNEDRTYGA